MKNLKQHPLKNIVERLSSDEIESLLFCEGLVDLTNPEIKSVCESDWFKSLPSFQRALFVCAAVGHAVDKFANSSQGLQHERAY